MSHAMDKFAIKQWHSISVPQELELMGHSAVIGGMLMAFLYFALVRAKKTGKGDANPSEILIAASNVLFMGFGMTGVMILVNNNLARAFAMGAAIALIRFRIKVDNK